MWMSLTKAGKYKFSFRSEFDEKNENAAIYYFRANKAKPKNIKLINWPLFLIV